MNRNLSYVEYSTQSKMLNKKLRKVPSNKKKIVENGENCFGE